MIFSSIPMVYATDGISSSVEDETSISAENGLSKIIENLTEAEDEYANSGYSISDMIFDGTTANVTVNVPDACTLVVAVYDEDTLEMIATATKQLSASVYSEDYRKDIISVDMNILVLPEHFLAKAFLLDENKNALCKNYTCRTYTTAFETFMETTPDDFEGKDIITLDNNCDDFGVLADGAVTAKKSETMTYTYNNGVYTFYNAIDEVKNLKTDDIFYYQLSDEIGDFLLIKVVSVDVDGSTVTIVEDDEIAIGDAFQFIRIDEDADFSDIELTEDNLGSALSFQEPEMQASTFSAKRDIVVEETESYSTSVNIKYPQDDPNKDSELDKGLEVKGCLKYTLTASVNLYYDARWGEDFYEFKTDLTHNIGVDITFSGKIELNKEAFKISFPTIPLGILELDISVYPVVSAEAAVKVFGSFDVYNRLSYTDSDGLTQINDTNWWKFDGDLGETEVEITIGLGVDFDIGFKKGKKDNEGLKTLHASVAVAIEAGVKGTFVPSLVGNLLDKHHDCVICLEGSLSIFAKGKATLKLKIISKNTKVNWDAIDLTFTALLGEFYFSIGPNGVKLGFGTCPNISHKVTVTVYDKNNNPVKDAIVSTTTGYCDANGDKKFNETSMTTNEKGQVVFYFPKGQHEIIAKTDGIGTGGQKFEMLANEKEIDIELFDAEYFNGHWYKIFDISKSWTDAKSYCESLGGHLVTITSQNEQSFIENTFLSNNTKKHFYLVGGYRDNSYSEWKWITGEIFSYSKWGANGDEANQNYNTEQNYIWISSSIYTGHEAPMIWISHENYNYKDSIWNTNKAGFICEWETIPSTRKAVSYRMTNYNLVKEIETTDEIVLNGNTATYTKALKETEYVLAVIKDESEEEFFSNENLLYIDQKTAESSTISFDFVLPENATDYTVKIFGISHTHTADEPIKENEKSATCTSTGSYDNVTYCSVCNEELSRENITTNMLSHTEETIKGYAPTCTETGLTDGIKCFVCGKAIVEQTAISTTDHKDNDGDYECDFGCGFEFEKPDDSGNCSCNCHKTGFSGFIWKILRFFYKLFGMKKTCACGATHY